MNETELSKKIKDIASENSIDVIGFADASEFIDYKWANSKRKNPKLTMETSKTIIVVGIYIGGLSLPFVNNKLYGRTSRLYLSEFFLDAVKPLLPIYNYLIEHGYKAIICESSTSAGSILPLKLAALRAGLGWQGKNSLLISKKFGSFLALGGILTDAALEYNSNEEINHCNKCTNCSDACPLGALNKEYNLEYEKCLAYLLQIEDFPKKYEAVVENRIGDCEICQDACPWNKKHLTNPLQTKLTKRFNDKIDYWKNNLSLESLKNMSEDKYIDLFGRLNTGISYNIFKRNVELALNNLRKN